MPTKPELNAQIRSLKRQVTALQEEVASLNGNLATCKTDKAAVAAELAAKAAQLETCRQQLEQTQADLADAEQTIGNKDARIAALQAEVDGKNEQIADLAAEVARLTALLEEEEEPDPPTASTLFGVTISGGVKKNMPDLHDDVAVSRVFAAGTKNWSQEGQHKAFPNGKWAVSNSYELSEAELPAFLASIPDADKKKIVAYADGHELENPDKGLKPADVKARMRRTSKVIHDAGLKSAFCLMQWTLVPASGRNWLDWVDPEVVDYFAWDAYNSGAKNDKYTAPADILDRIVAISKQYGKPFMIWETGTNNFGAQAPRVAWTKALRAELIKEKAATAIWFDRPSTSGSSWDATLDRPTAEAWLIGG